MRCSAISYSHADASRQLGIWPLIDYQSKSTPVGGTCQKLMVGGKESSEHEDEEGINWIDLSLKAEVDQIREEASSAQPFRA